jgi:hypothetical protein
MLPRVLAFQRLDDVPQRFVSRNRRQTSYPAEFRDTPSETVNQPTAAPRLTIGTVIYLVSFGIVAATTVGVLFGVAFLLLAHPKVAIVADLLIHHNDAEVSQQRSDTFSPSDSSGSAPTERGSSSEPAAKPSDDIAAPPLSIPDWTAAIPFKYPRTHRSGAQMTRTTADLLNHQELAGLLAGRAMPPLSGMQWGRMRGGRHQEHTGRE